MDPDVGAVLEGEPSWVVASTDGEGISQADPPPSAPLDLNIGNANGL